MSAILDQIRAKVALLAPIQKQGRQLTTGLITHLASALQYDVTVLNPDRVDTQFLVRCLCTAQHSDEQLNAMLEDQLWPAEDLPRLRNALNWHSMTWGQSQFRVYTTDDDDHGVCPMSGDVHLAFTVDTLQAALDDQFGKFPEVFFSCHVGANDKRLLTGGWRWPFRMEFIEMLDLRDLQQFHKVWNEWAPNALTTLALAPPPVT